MEGKERSSCCTKIILDLNKCITSNIDLLSELFSICRDSINILSASFSRENERKQPFLLGNLYSTVMLGHALYFRYCGVLLFWLFWF